MPTDRDDDLRMLRDALELENLDDRARDAFANMLSVLERVRGDELSAKQRKWVRAVLGEPDYENLASKNGTETPRAVRHNHPELAECRSACPAWTPPALRNLPKKPPGRKVAP